VYSAGFDIRNFPPDGLMGLAFPSLSAFNATPTFETLISEGAVDSPVFGFKFSTTSNSELFLGGVNDALFTGDITWVSLSNEVCRAANTSTPA
jgi:Eukaryotic aspartyl protease